MPPTGPVAPPPAPAADAGAEPVWCGQVASTQDAAREELRRGRRAPFALATDDQRVGRGRLARSWTTPPGDGLALTLVHAPAVPPAGRSWYPLVAALAARRAACEVLDDEVAGSGAGGAIGCKWPNDLLDARGRKLAGILVEGTGSGELLVGIGMNLRGPVTGADGAPLAGAVGLRELGAPAAAARDLAGRLAGILLAELRLLDAAEGDGVGSGQADRYRETCVTIGARVRVEGIARSAGGPPGGAAPAPPVLEGRAIGIDPRGRLLVRTDEGVTVPVDVGDVHHLRATGEARRPLGQGDPHGRAGAGRTDTIGTTDAAGAAGTEERTGWNESARA